MYFFNRCWIRLPYWHHNCQKIVLSIKRMACWVFNCVEVPYSITIICVYWRENHAKTKIENLFCRSILYGVKKFSLASVQFRATHKKIAIQKSWPSYIFFIIRDESKNKCDTKVLKTRKIYVLVIRDIFDVLDNIMNYKSFFLMYHTTPSS